MAFSRAYLTDVIGLLVLPGRIDPKASERLISAFEEMYNYMKHVTGFRAHGHFQKYIDKILGKVGLIDAWIALIALTSLSLGIADGKEKIVKIEDVDRAIKIPCDETPPCPVMMLDRFVKALEVLEKAIL